MTPPVAVSSTMSGAECVPNSESEEDRPSNEDIPRASAQCEDEFEGGYGSQRVNDALKRWYHVNLQFNFKFPENFNDVPATSANESLWLQPMDYGEAAQRLLGLKENTGQDQLPPAVINYYTEIVEFASNKFADLQRNLIYNDHHLEVLKKSKDNGKLPNFLKLNPVKVRFFSEEETTSLTQKYQQALDEAAAKMLDYTLAERESLGAKLCSEAEKLNEEVETEAMTKWMESQGTNWNRWDHLYKVTAYIKIGEELRRIRVPLSTCVFRTAMKRCRTKVSTQLEENRQNKIQEEAKKRKEEKARRAAVNEATSLPRQAAEKRIQETMDEKLQPIMDRIRSMEEQLQKNETAPPAADQDGAAAKSATKKRKKSKRPRATECVEASLVTKKRKHRPVAEQIERSSASSRPEGPSRQKDRPRGTESSGKGKASGKRKKPKVTSGDQE